MSGCAIFPPLIRRPAFLSYVDKSDDLPGHERSNWQMPGLYRCLPAIFLMTFGAVTAHSADKSQSTCTSGDLVRRVVVEVGDLSTALPCEVVYWKDSEAPGVRRVLWNARTDASYCDAKAAGLVDKLASAGWNCSGDGQAAAAAPAPAAPSTVTASTTASSNVATDQTAAAATSNVQAVDAATVARVQPTAPAPEPQQPAPSAGNAALAATPSAPATSTTPAPAVNNDLQTAAVVPNAPASTGDVNQLQTVIQANLSSLNQSVDGDFEAQIGDFGDLNNDGIDDAVVFFNYESSAADFTQFVAAYLFNGQNYHLAATKPVGGTDLAVRQVLVEEIVNGLIQLRLVLNDASQTEDRRAAMILKDGQLVETE